MESNYDKMSKINKILDIVSDEEPRNASNILAGAMVEAYDRFRKEAYIPQFKNLPGQELMRAVQESAPKTGVKVRSTFIEGHANKLEVTAGTTGLMGGDGSFSFFSIKETLCRGTTVVKVDDEALDFSVEIGGDSEVQTMIKALKFIVQTLEEGIASKE